MSTLSSSVTPGVRQIVNATRRQPEYVAWKVKPYLRASYPKRLGLEFTWSFLNYLVPTNLIETVSDLPGFDEARMEELITRWAKDNDWDYDTLITNLADAYFVMDDGALPETSPNRHLQGKPEDQIPAGLHRELGDAIADALDGMGLLAPGADKAVLDAVIKVVATSK